MQSDDDDAIERAFVGGKRGDANTALAAEAAFAADQGDLCALAYWLGHSLRRTPRKGGELPTPVADRAAWLIEHHPASSLTSIIHFHFGTLGFENYAKLRTAWLSAVDAHRGEARVFSNAAQFFAEQEPDRAQDLLREAVALDPSNTKAATSLASSIMLSRIGLDLDDPTAAQIADTKAREAVSILERALSVLPHERESSVVLMDLANAAAAANEWTKVGTAAEQLLKCVDEHDLGWMHGNAIYYGHSNLGRAALGRGDVEEAKRRLLAAGRTRGSPQLDSFGPDMTLAKALLARGEREVILQFLQLCRTFWKMDRGRLDKWTTMIRDGSTPSLEPFEFDY
jgi:hypothetical protein